jgi:hypothetical protein
MIRKALRIVREAGLGMLAQKTAAFIHRRAIRPLLPVAGPVDYAGIHTCHDRKWGDRAMPAMWRGGFLSDDDAYESGLVAALREQVRAGDRIVVVGGGIGVTAAVAALQAGPSGHVECFEGASEGVAMVRTTAQRNGVAGRVTVHHAVVARSIAVYGTEPDRAAVPPEALPACDLLELDCEGAEVDILRSMTITPRTILVETHGDYGAPTSLVVELLEARGYRTSRRGPAESRFRDYCDAHDIQVVVGVRDTTSGTA